MASEPESRIGVAFRDRTTLEKPRLARDRRFSRGYGVIKVRGYRKSKVRRKVWTEEVRVSGGKVKHDARERRTYFAGDFGGRTGTSGSVSLLRAALIGGLTWKEIHKSSIISSNEMPELKPRQPAGRQPKYLEPS